MLRDRNARRALLLLMVLAVAFLWAADQGIRAAASDRAEKSATSAGSADKAVTRATVSGATTTAKSATSAGSANKAVTRAKVNGATTTAKSAAKAAAAPQSQGQGAQPIGPQGQTGQMRSTTQTQRKAARINRGPQRTVTAVTFAGINPATAALSPLAGTGTPSGLVSLADGLVSLADMTPGAIPDYFGVANYANSPLPTFAAGTGSISTVVGNPMSARATTSDSATNVFIVLPTPLPSAGTLQSFQTWDQMPSPGVIGGPSGGNSFHAYVLRPTAAADQYVVVFDSGQLTVPIVGFDQVATYPVTPFSVLAGDLIAFYGQGIPFDRTPAGTNLLFYPANTAPALSGTITLGGAAYPLYPQARTYAFAATVIAAGPSTIITGGALNARATTSDSVTNVFVILQQPLPTTGTLQSFLTWDQMPSPGVIGGPSGGNSFHAYVLRPTAAAGQFTVAFDSGQLTVPIVGVDQVATYPVTPFPVFPGDRIAFYGQGIPFDRTQVATNAVYYPANTAPTLSGTIIPGDAAFPLYPQARSYAFAAAVSAVGPTNVITGGMRKFVDTLPALPLGAPDTTTFPGSDYYEISLEQYYQVMHADLATANGGQGTELRGYRQTNGPSPQVRPVYLGPVILATKNRPVRVKFTNNLPTGSGGNLFIPTDTTYMGAGLGPDGTAYAENRATLHLHGGNTPWISDGTPHQWTAPRNEPTNFKKGVSTAYVPDMWFNASGDLLPASSGCQGTRTCAVPGATNNPGDGSMTFYWTNQQSGRLMFYHDHAYGITRLNVYAGEAAGFLVADPVEEAALRAATVPGTIITNPATGAVTSADLAHLVPLIIQDKSFVPDNGTAAGSQLAATDPTWEIARWGGFGNLWFPHVYTPNQNPYDPSGANAYGRWDYGPWFWPPMDPATLVGLPFPCGTTVCPGTPTPSGTPEAFMDTPVVNGKAYPTLTVDPAAYRFQILSAGNDRTFNLGLYVADNLAVAVTGAGSGYSATAPPLVTFTSTNGVTGTGTGTAIVSTGVVTDITLTAAGSGYTTAPAVIIDPPACTLGPACVQATAIATISAAAGSTGGPITSIAVTNGGAGYTVVPNVTITPNVPGCGGGGPACAAATAAITAPGQILGITVAGASGWTAAPTVVIAPPPAGGVTAAAIASVNTEVKMVPAVAPTAGSPLQACATLTPITTPGLGVGLATSNIYDGVNNITGLPQNCWPVYSRDPGLPAPAMWPTDGREGGVPDPTTAGPPLIQIGTEGGLLPAAVVIPSTPTGYEYNRRSITVLNIAAQGLLLGPAERADVIVDFSRFAGKTLILYNDAPAPVPASDPRIDYFTGDTDLTGTGGAPTTLPGLGPNIRTIMQINVNATGTANGFSLPALQAALPGIYSGTLAAPNQPAPIVNPGIYARIQDNALVNGTGPVISVTVTAGGSRYTTPPTVTFVPSGATGTATIGTGPLVRIQVSAGGSGYRFVPTVTIAAPPAPGIRATATATVVGGAVTAITLTDPGSGYGSVPAVTITGGQPTTPASATAVWAGGPVTGVTASGGVYSSIPSVFFTGGGGRGARGTATLGNSFPLLSKTIQELFTLDYGRMNATLGVELPFTNFLTQTTIPYGYIDPPTEIFRDGETQLWKITHNGVDTHFIHFHLFNVQVINRVGWDGAVKPPDANELGWKDTVRMNPLEDIVVALKPMKQVQLAATDLDVSNLPNSVRPLDVTAPVGSGGQFTDIDPTNQPAVVTNDLTNFGWEYVWHCHILGHEENDMMRAMIMLVAPSAPGSPTTTLAGTVLTPQVIVSWTNNATNATGFLIERATVTGGVTGAYATVGTVSNLTTFTDNTVARLTTYKYRVTALNTGGYTQLYAAPAIGYPSQTVGSLPTVQVGTITTQ